jgi:NAD-dependent deacetylase
MVPATLDELAIDLSRGPLLVVTGAGISLASGIPTFRGTDPHAVWSESVLAMGTRAYFERDPVGSWRWYTSRFGVLRGKEPNPGHQALVEIERQSQLAGRAFLLVTQNVDSLHERAGAEQVVKVHGSADRVRCSRIGCRYAAPFGSLPSPDAAVDAFMLAPRAANLPRCPACGAYLRPHILWFDEAYTDHQDYQFARATDAAEKCASVLFVGTSFAVGITDLILEATHGRVPVWSMDPAGARPAPRVRVLARKAEEALPELAARLAEG